MPGSRKFCQSSPNVSFLLNFLVDEGIEDPITTKWPIISLPAKRYLNGVSLAG